MAMVARVPWLLSLLADERSWRRAVIAVAVLALVLRLAIAAITGGGNDLKLYYTFSSLVTGGLNPYHAPPGFPFPDRLGDNLPGEYLLFAGVLEIDHSKYALRALFALADAGTILLIGLRYPRPIVWRAAVVLFYAFNPLVLGSWTATSEDKTLLFGLLAALFLALETGRVVRGWAAAAAIGVLKGVSIVFVPFLAWETWRRRGLRFAAACVGGFTVVMVLGHLPWFPDGFVVYSRRNGHLEFREPGHAAFTQFLDRVGLYDVAIVKYGVPLLLVATFAAYVRRRIGVIEAIVLAQVATLVLQPDHSYTRALLAALPFLFLIRLDARRWIVLWVVSAIGAVGIYLQQERGQLGGYGSLEHVVASNLFLVLVIALYARDKLGASGGAAAGAPSSTGVPSYSRGSA
jgi:hypothetical protein